MEQIRIDKFLSKQLNISRSQVKQILKSGRVNVNDNFVYRGEDKIDPDCAQVFVDGQAVNYSKNVYIMLNKPKGILSASNDKNRRTVIDLIPEEMKRQGLFPVGRLDKDTTGLLIITDDGESAHKIISPKNKTGKVYIAVLDGSLSDDMIDAFKSGVTLADGTKCRPSKLEIIDSTKAKLTLFDGKYHQVKRMFGVFGLGVLELHREAIGELYLPKDLKTGECRFLDDFDIKKTL